MTDLIQFIQECKANNDGQRFGQLLYNMMARYDKSQWKDSDFVERLFYIDDKDLIDIIKAYEGNGIKNT
jgi:hypothetical protein